MKIVLRTKDFISTQKSKTRKSLRAKIAKLNAIDYNRTQQSESYRKHRDKLYKENTQLKEVLNLIGNHAAMAFTGNIIINKELDDDGKIIVTVKPRFKPEFDDKGEVDHVSIT